MKESIHFFNDLILAVKKLLISLDEQAYFIKTTLTIK